MQRNCHEFIAYENLVGQARRAETRGRPAASQQPINQVVPLVRRPLKLLSEREVSPQLGLLKSTLLQLDSTFSERSYGASTFLDFAEKLAAAGVVSIRRSGHNLAVDLVDEDERPARVSAPTEDADTDASAAADEPGPAPAGSRGSLADGLREVRRLFHSAPAAPRWPMYLRHVKQVLRTIDPTFDERSYGFSGLNELVRACQKDGLFRLERGRQGVLRVFPGALLQSGVVPPRPGDQTETAAIEAGMVVSDRLPQETVEAPVLDAAEISSEKAPPAETAPPKRSRRRAAAGGTEATVRKPAARRGRSRKSREDI
jgi:hypothetical protein